MPLRRTSAQPALRKIEHRDPPRDLAGLAEQLGDLDATRRRWAARDLADTPGGIAVLCRRLPEETDKSVREAILLSLARDGAPDALAAITAMLRSEDASERNAAIETLAAFPDAAAPWIDRLLDDDDADVRIFVVNLLGELRNPRVGSWLDRVLADEEQVNVVAAAIEVLAEVGTRGSLPALAQARARFAGDPFIAFAAQMAQERIEAS